jgi:hypothetical protein
MFSFGFDNKHLEEYFSLVSENSTARYTEKHHIFPKSIFGENEKLVKLTFINHFKAHVLLYRALLCEFGPSHPWTCKMAYTLIQFKGNQKYRLNEVISWSVEELDLYSKLFEEGKVANRIAMSGENNPFFGKKHTEETLKRIQASRAWYKDSEETKWKKGKPSRDRIEQGVVSVYDQVTGKYFWFDDSQLHILSDSRYLIGYKREPKFTPSIIDHLWQRNDPEYELLKFSMYRKQSTTGKEHWWQDKINKNPEKIRKTAEKHRGKKRPEKTKKLISESKKLLIAKNGGALNKGKRMFANPDDLSERLQCKPEDAPGGWVPARCRKFMNIETGEISRFYLGDVPDGWVQVIVREGEIIRVS